MKATCWMGRGQVEVLDVPDPQLLNTGDAIVEVTATSICGSDLHLLHGYMPSMRRRDVLGHEFMGQVVETGSSVRNLMVGDRVVVPFPIACGNCTSCRRELYSLCENSNPNAAAAQRVLGHSGAGIFGYSHLMGGFAGGQAQYVRVPFADVGPLRIEEDLPDEKVLFLSDVLPTGYMAAKLCDLRGGETVAIWGAGPVGQFAAMSAYLLGASSVVVIDALDYRLDLVAGMTGCRTINYETTDVLAELREITAGRGPDACVDAVGMEAHSGTAVLETYDRAKQAVRLETDRPHALRQAILACRNGGTVSVVGGYGGFIDKFPIGSVMNRSLTIRSGQCHVQRYMRPLLERISQGQIDPAAIITHRMPLAQAAAAYELFESRADGCNKVVLAA